MCAAYFVDPGKRTGSKVFACGDGFSYHLNKVKQHQDGSRSLYLRCARYRLGRCFGTATMVQFRQQHLWIEGARHKCVADPNSHQERLLRQEVMEACRTHPYENPRQLLNRIAAGYPVAVASRIRLAQIRFAMRRSRLMQYPNIPASLQELGDLLGSEQFSHLTETLDKRDYIYSGTVGEPGERCIVFASRRMLRCLSKVKTIFADATFASTPVQPAGQQVYQIVTILRNNVFPLVQVIMEKKTYHSYRSILVHLKEVEPGFKPRRVMIDFESAQYKAWSTEYTCEVLGCYFHNVRAVQKKAAQLGLRRSTVNPCIKSIVRCLLAIPLLPQDLMRRGFSSLVNLARRKGVMEDLANLFSYYMNTWLTGWRFQMSSVFNQPHRTNNGCESAHRILRAETGPHHPNIWVFINGLRQYEQCAYTDYQVFKAGQHVGTKRRISVILNDHLIKIFLEDLLAGDISIHRFLVRASRRLTELLHAGF